MNQNPNVTPSDVEACIASEHYFTAADGAGRQSLTVEDVGAGGLIPSPLFLLTFCVLVTRNGHTVTGEAHCQNPAKFDASIGRTEARKDAIKKLWPMVVYAEREKLAHGTWIKGTIEEAADNPEAATDTLAAS